MNVISRRARVDLMIPEELAIRATIHIVENAGAHVLLTEAVTLLGKAQEKVADWFDNKELIP